MVEGYVNCYVYFNSFLLLTSFLISTFNVDYCVCVKPITLCNCLCSSSSSSSCFSASVIRNIEEFGAKNYFTDHQTANTIHDVRDSVPVLKIHDCYWDTQKFAKFQLLPKHRLNNFQDRDLFLVRKRLCIIYQHIVWMCSGVITWIKKYIYIHPSDNKARTVCWCIYILLQYHVLITSAHIPNTMVLTNLLVNTYTYILY